METRSRAEGQTFAADIDVPLGGGLKVAEDHDVEVAKSITVGDSGAARSKRAAPASTKNPSRSGAFFRHDVDDAEVRVGAPQDAAGAADNFDAVDDIDRVGLVKKTRLSPGLTIGTPFNITRTVNALPRVNKKSQRDVFECSKPGTV